MKRALAWLLIALLGALWPGMAEEAGTVSEDYEPLYVFAEAHGFRLGGAFGAADMSDGAFMDFLGRHFDSLTCTNETKAYSLLDQQACKAAEDGMPRMNFSTADRMVGWCAERGIGVRGHALVWDAYMLDWFFREGYDANRPYADRETVRARLDCYIRAVIGHFEEEYPGVIYCWDVVNEAIGDNPGDWDSTDARHIRTRRDGAENPFYAHVGEDYVEFAFLCAREAVDALGAEIRLIYNDYNLFDSRKRDAALALADSIQNYAVDETGAPRRLLDGIGMQGYLGGYGTQQGCLDPGLLNRLETSIRSYAERGLEVQITEMAVRNYDPDRAAEHAAYYARLFTDVFMKVNAGESRPLTAVCVWGLRDVSARDTGSYAYLLNSPYGGLLTQKGRVKTSFDAVYRALTGAE